MYFKNSTHEYFVNNKKYISFSALKKYIEPEKDWEEIAMKYAKKNKMTVKEVKELWYNKGKIAREKGTAVHLHKENLLKEVKDSPVYFSEGDEEIKTIKSIENLEDGIYPELILYNNEFEVCGTADLVKIETIKGKRYVDISDYKTSEKIDINSYQHPVTKKHQMLLPPCQNLMDCNFSLYALQLSTYAFFLERYNYIPRNLNIIHLKMVECLPEDSIAEVDGLHYKIEEEIFYPTPYLKKEVKALLKYYKNKKNEKLY